MISTNSFVIVGREAESVDYPEIRTRFISPGYPEVMSVPVREGRSLTDGDDRESPYVILINETGAERYFPDRTAVGQQLRFWGITWNMVLEAGGLLVSKEVDLEIEVELIRR